MKKVLIILIVIITTFLSITTFGQTTRYVKPTASGLGDGSSWANASADLQTMINASAANDEVWVAAGTHKPTKEIDGTNDQSRFFTFFINTDGIKIYGGFAGTESLLSERNVQNNTTILSGDIGIANDASDNVYHVMYINPISSNTVIDGFTISNGNANGSAGQGDGGGIYMPNFANGSTSSPTISNCTISNNNATTSGGGVLIYNSSGTVSPTFNNCIFKNNTGGAGGAVNMIVLAGTNNTAFNGCLFYDNIALSFGGAIYHDGDDAAANPTFTNCTFTDNTNANGGAFYNRSVNGTGQVTMTNCILWSNGSTPIGENVSSTGGFVMNYSIYDDGSADGSVILPSFITGSNNLDSDPLFTDAANNNYRFPANSPAFNAGDNAAWTATGLTVDLTGTSRPQNATIDLGVYEIAYTQGLWDGDAGDGLWTSITNWSGDLFPTASDNVVIDNGDAVAISTGTVTVNTISMSNSSELTINAGTTLNVNNTGTNRSIDTNGDNCKLTNAGTINITGGSYGIDFDGGNWTNQSGSITNISSFSIYGFYNSDDKGALVHQGTMTIDGNGSGNGIYHKASLTNTGTITVQNTSNGITLADDDLISNSGTINVNNSGGTSLSTFWFLNNTSGNISITNAGSIAFKAEYELNNKGTITINGATGIGVELHEINYYNTGSISISGTNGDALHYNEYISPSQSTSFSNTGILKGTGTFDTENNAVSGTIIPAGTAIGVMTFPTNQTFSSATMQVQVNGTTAGTTHDQIIVNGTATISGTLNATIGYTPTKGDRIEIITATAISGTFSTVTLPYDWKIVYSATKVELVYDYTVGRWDGEVGDGLWSSADNWEGGILPTAGANIVIDNGDGVTISSGTVTVNTISLTNAELTINAGVTLNVANSGSGNSIETDGSSELYNYGTLNISGGSNGIYYKSGVTIDNELGGVIDVSSFTSYALFNADNNGSLNNNGSIQIDGGGVGNGIYHGTNFTNNGSITVQNTSSGLQISGGETFTNNGTISIANSGTTSLSTSWFVNAATGTVSITNASYEALITNRKITNQGTISINGATGVGIDLNEVSFENTGSVTISGTGGDALNYNPYTDPNAHATSTFSNTGTLKGAGTFDIDITTLGGTIVPGTSTGVMSFPNSQTFAPSTTMQFEINGTTAGTQHDQIVVNGTATISGTLNASFGYAYQNSDRIVIISATAISGTFSSDNLPTDWSIDYSQVGEVALVYSGVSLPVELLDFIAEKQNENVLLSWQTASELNNSHFEVEWSINGIEFTKIGQVEGAGTTNDMTTYDFLHTSPALGLNYYRLKQIDFDGQFEYTDIVSVNYELGIANYEFKVFPNPAVDYITIEGINQSELVQIYNVNGQIVNEFQVQNNRQQIALENLPSGTYFIKIKQQVKKLIVKR